MGALKSAKDFMYRPQPLAWWVWPAMLLVMGVGAVGAALVFYPGGDEWTYIFGWRFGSGCAFVDATGQPCPSCGMTRSWVHLARGEILTSIRYNIAGAVLLGWLAVGGVLGGLRLLKRDERFLKVPYSLAAGFGLFWMIVLYMGVWVARLFGINPLPLP